jgi:hypothetical protein
MALKTTINLSTPDKIETKVDVTLSPRGRWKRDDSDPPVWTFTLWGIYRTVRTDTIKTWFACTLSACQAAASTYSGSGLGSYAYEETVEALHSYTFRITESELTRTLVKEEEEA